MILRTALLAFVCLLVRQVAAQTCEANSYLQSVEINLARSCGEGSDQACASRLSTSSGTSTADKGTDDIVDVNGNFVSTRVTNKWSNPTVGGTNTPHFYEIDLGRSRLISSVRIFAAGAAERLQNGLIRHGTSQSNSNPSCATHSGNNRIEQLACSVSARYIGLWLPYNTPPDSTNNYLELRELQILSGGCAACPGALLSAAGSVSATQCGCTQGNYTEYYVSRPWIDVSMRLDSVSNTRWIADSTNTYFIQMTATYIFGIILQGSSFSTDYVKAFTMTFRDAIENKIFPINDGNAIVCDNGSGPGKCIVMLPFPIYTIGLGFKFTSFSGTRASTRMSFVHMRCTECTGGVGAGITPLLSTSMASCTCSEDFVKVFGKGDHRAIALVSLTGRFSTMANRAQLLYVNAAQPITTDGPAAGVSTVLFEKGTMDYIDGGPHSFNIAEEGGFTAVVLIRFKDDIRGNIFDFGHATNGDRIVLTTTIAQSGLQFLMYNGDDECKVALAFSIGTTWFSIVAAYDLQKNELSLDVDGNRQSVICTTARTSREVDYTYLGRILNIANPVNAQNHISAVMAGVYAVDSLLTGPELTRIRDRMYAGQDVLAFVCEKCPPEQIHDRVAKECRDCPSNAFPDSEQRTCLCNLGFSGPASGPCVICASGTYKEMAGPADCVSCQDFATSPEGSVSSASCTCVVGFSTGAEGAAVCERIPNHQIALCTNLSHATAHVLALDADQHSVANLQETGCVHIDPCTQLTRAGLPAAAGEWHHVADLGLTSSEDGAHFNYHALEYARVPQGVVVETCPPDFAYYKTTGSWRCDANPDTHVRIAGACPSAAPHTILDCLAPAQFDAVLESSNLNLM